MPGLSTKRKRTCIPLFGSLRRPRWSDQGTPRYFIGRIEEDLGKYEESLAAYRQAGELAPHWVSVPLRMGAIYLTKKQYGLAEASFRRALELDPKCEKAREGLERARRKDE